PVPLAFQVGVGQVPWFPPLDGPTGTDPDRERDHVLTLLAMGIRGFNLVMAVERDGYYGAAIARSGTLERHAAWLEPLLRTLAEVDWPALRRVSVIALVATRADLRFGLATSLLDPVTPVLVEALGLGPAGAAELGTDAGAVLARRWQTALTTALELAQVPYAIVDEAATAEELAGYRAVIVPTGARIDHGLWRRITTLAEHRKTIVVIGPGTPTRDELDQPLVDAPPRRVGRLKEGSLEDLRGLADDLTALAGELPDAWQVERPDDVRAQAYADAGGVTRVVFVLSDAPKPITAVLLTDEHARQLRDPFSGERIRVAGGKASVSLAGRGVRMLLVET
ncbi:MAG: hypothetical protein H0X17_00930, partial [Deltaproteobacteria bacterium]|nr:hypothetical protein [Deltaproteobacteria bacterium]